MMNFFPQDSTTVVEGVRISETDGKIGCIICYRQRAADPIIIIFLWWSILIFLVPVYVSCMVQKNWDAGIRSMMQVGRRRRKPDFAVMFETDTHGRSAYYRVASERRLLFRRVSLSTACDKFGVVCNNFVSTRESVSPYVTDLLPYWVRAITIESVRRFTYVPVLRNSRWKREPFSGRDSQQHRCDCYVHSSRAQ